MVSQWFLDNPGQGALFLALLYIVGIPLTFPAMIIVLLGSYVSSHVFGFYKGMAFMVIFNFVFQHCGMLLAFVLGRYLFRDFIYQLAVRKPLFKGINLACKSHGSYITFLMRCSFILPFSLVNYVLSVTDIRMRDYMIGNIGLLVPSMVYIYIGSSAQRILSMLTNNEDTQDSDDVKKIELTMMIVGGVFLITLICMVGYLTKQQLNRMIAEQEGEERQLNDQTVQSDEPRSSNYGTTGGDQLQV